MISKQILSITFLKEPELNFFFLHPVKWFQVLLCNSNNLASVICLHTFKYMYMYVRDKFVGNFIFK